MKKLWISWFLKRSKAKFPFVITATFCILTIYYYWVIQSYNVLTTSSHMSIEPTEPSSSSHSHEDYWLIVDSNEYGLCNKLSTTFSHWVILFVSRDAMSRFSCRSLPTSVDSDRSVFSAFKYALERGAKAIYVADLASDLDTFSRVSTFPGDATGWGLVHASNASVNSSFNTREHFGCSSAKLSAPSAYSLCRRKTALFVPAVTSRVTSAAVCDVSAPDVTMGLGSFVDIVSTGSLYMQSGFWVFHSFNETEYSIIWSCMVQWLLWQTENRLTVYWSRVGLASRHRSSSKIGKIIEVLFSLRCEDDFIRCTYHASQHLIDARLVSEHFLPAVQEWFNVLTTLRYKFPRLSAERTCTDHVYYRSLDYSSSSGSRRIPVANLAESLSMFDKTCSLGFDDVSAKVSLAQPWKQFAGIVLVITFNEPHYEVIPYLEILYRSIFPRIVYCGPHIDFSRHENLQRYKFVFITYSVPSVNNVSGALNYECAVKVSRINFNVDGYLFISDDLLAFPSSLARLRDDLVWYIPESEIRVGDLKTLRECNLGMCDFRTNWRWWKDYRNATISALEGMRSKCGVSSLLCSCVSTLKQLNGEFLRVNGGYSDIFYIPRRLMQDFASIADVFLTSGVFLEIAVPTILRCLQRSGDVQELPGKQIWDSTRVEPWKYFRRTDLFGKTYLHPVKWSNLTTFSESHVSFYCNSVLPHLYDPFSVLTD